jgi:hypothetical protein
MGLFCIFIYYNIYHKFCPSLYRYGVGGRVDSLAGPDVSGRYKGGVLALKYGEVLLRTGVFYAVFTT